MTTLAARFPPTPFATTARSPLSLCGMLGLSFMSSCNRLRQTPFSVRPVFEHFPQSSSISAALFSGPVRAEAPGERLAIDRLASLRGPCMFSLPLPAVSATGAPSSVPLTERCI
ncbi:hypothetical protein BD311DRAFT_768869 [Dichomitus squalens]|uniref:Uncharacterized protein n=1 Tax=Dichomitus squalens TaxID=114155 RepID=A0A4Q9M8H5_9APHY|nr:hypothetical protein BD311DRAFT_768869 [Dichomitus squalens]